MPREDRSMPLAMVCDYGRGGNEILFGLLLINFIVILRVYLQQQSPNLLYSLQRDLPR